MSNSKKGFRALHVLRSGGVRREVEMDRVGHVLCAGARPKIHDFFHERNIVAAAPAKVLA